MVTESVHLRTTSRRGPAASRVKVQWEAQTPAQRQLHGMWLQGGGGVNGHRCQLGPCMRPGLRAHKCAGAWRQGRQNTRSRKCRLRIRDAWDCQPCGQSPKLVSRMQGERAPSRTARQSGHACQPSSWRSARAAAAASRLADWRPPSASESAQDSVKAGRRWRRAGRASAHPGRKPIRVHLPCTYHIRQLPAGHPIMLMARCYRACSCDYVLHYLVVILLWYLV